MQGMRKGQARKRSAHADRLHCPSSLHLPTPNTRIHSEWDRTLASHGARVQHVRTRQLSHALSILGETLDRALFWGCKDFP